MTPDIGGICRSHLQYMKWADNLLLKAIQANLPDRAETLQHIFLAERIWMARVRRTADPRLLVPPAGLEALATEWPALHEQWLNWADSQSDWGQVVGYKTLAGAEHESPLWQIVLHVANHGSFHRGQVAAQLRAADFAPPATDLIAWYWLGSGEI